MRTVMVPLPVAAVLTGGISWRPSRTTFEPLLLVVEGMGAGPGVRVHAAAQSATTPKPPTHRERFTTGPSKCMGHSPYCWLSAGLVGSSLHPPPNISPNVDGKYAIR